MKKILVFFIIFLCLANSPYTKQERVNYISNGLKAFYVTENEVLNDVYNYISLVESNSCQSSYSDIKIECLLEASESNCKQRRGSKKRDNCKIYSDFIVVNKLGEKNFVSKSEKYRIMKQEKDYRSAILKKTKQKYASIALALYLSPQYDCKDADLDCLGKTINQFCDNYSNKRALSWQYCASALTWFIGISK